MKTTGNRVRPAIRKKPSTHSAKPGSASRAEAKRSTAKRSFTATKMESRELEQALHRSDKRLRSMLDSLLEGCLISSPDARCLYVNDAAAAQAHRTKEQLLGHTVTEVFSGIENTELFSAVRQCLAEQRPTRMENEFIFPDGSKGWFERSIQPIPEGVLILSTDITDRKQAEEAMRETEQTYRTLFDSISSGVAIYEAVNNGDDFVFKDFNRAGENIERIKREDIIGKRVTEVFQGVKEFGVFEVFQRVWRTGKSEYFSDHIYRDARDTGTWRDAWVYKLPGAEIVAVYNDVTERKRAEEQLRYQAALLEHINDAIIASDAKYRLTAWNAAAESLYGWKAEEILAQNGLQVLRTEWPGVDADPMRRAIAQAGHWRGEVTQRCKDGTRIPVEVSSVVLRDENGEITGYISVNRDITERKQAEAALRESEERFRTLFEQAAVGVALLETRTGRYGRINQKYCDFLGYTTEEMLDKTFTDVTYPGDTQPNIDSNAALMAGTIREFSIEKRFVRKDGEVVWGRLTASPLWRPGERPDTHFQIGVVEDITERKQVETALQESALQLRKMTRRLQEVEEIERRRLARELHDRAGQNLSALNINLHILRGQISGSSAQDAARRIDDSIELVDETMRHVRDVMAELHPPALEDFGLVAALREYAEKLSRRVNVAVTLQEVGETGIRLQSRMESALFRVAQEALTNIARHAQASRVILRFEATAELARLTVEDDGRGFDPADVAKPGESRGWGVLTMRERIEAIGGSFRVETEPGLGTKVIAQVPR